MVLIQKIDENKFRNKHTIYKNKHSGGSIHNSISNHHIYLKNGGFINIAPIADFITNNKELLSSGVNAISNVANVVSNISEAVKKSKELETLQTIKKLRKNKTPQEYKLSPEQIETIKQLGTKIGNGFTKF